MSGSGGEGCAVLFAAVIFNGEVQKQCTRSAAHVRNDAW
jgi:hypothetical protein